MHFLFHICCISCAHSWFCTANMVLIVLLTLQCAKDVKRDGIQPSCGWIKVQMLRCIHSHVIVQVSVVLLEMCSVLCCGTICCLLKGQMWNLVLSVGDDVGAFSCLFCSKEITRTNKNYCNFFPFQELFYFSHTLTKVLSCLPLVIMQMLNGYERVPIPCYACMLWTSKQSLECKLSFLSHVSAPCVHWLFHVCIWSRVFVWVVSGLSILLSVAAVQTAVRVLLPML